MNCQKMAWKKLITYLYARKNNPYEDYFLGQRQVWALKMAKPEGFKGKLICELIQALGASSSFDHFPGAWCR